MSNMPQSKAFYAGLFGWEFTAVPGMEKLAAEIVSDGQTIGSLRVAEGKISPYDGVVYIQVKDMTASCAKAKELGGLIPPGFPFNLSDGRGAIGLVANAVGPWQGDGIGFPGGGVSFGTAAVAPGVEHIDNAGTIAGSAFAIQVNSGQAVITNSGTINGAVRTLFYDDSLTNSGIWVVGAGTYFGDGNDTLVNTGTLRFGSSAAARAALAGGPQSLTLGGLETFKNGGLVDLRNGTAGDTQAAKREIRPSSSLSVSCGRRSGRISQRSHTITASISSLSSLAGGSNRSPGTSGAGLAISRVSRGSRCSIRSA